MRHTLRRSMELPLPPEEVFPFFAEAGNLQRITPPELGFRILSPEPIEMEEGTVLEYRLRLAGVPFSWTTTIAVWEPPHRFVDVQTRGPYTEWIHEHRFTATASGGTRIEDRVRYRLPLWPLGELAWPLVAWELARIFRYREDRIRALLPSERPLSAVVPLDTYNNENPTAIESTRRDPRHG